MKKSLHYFRSSFAVTLLGIVGAIVIGGWAAVFVTLILAVLEVSLSFDNAIINAKVLQNMDQKWRRRFLTWGMLIAVFGMRLVFPVAIVSIVAGLTPWNAFSLALYHPDEYAHALEAAHVVISGFGGGFLLMVFLRYFFDREKEIHWIKLIEKRLTKFARLESIEIVIALLVTYFVSQFVSHDEAYHFLVAGILGIVGFLIVKGIEGLLHGGNHSGEVAVAKTGLATFLYLEILDASFSFDGVIGAFALSKNIFIIMIGLGIGAMFVRSLTLYFVGQGTLAQFIYLEHGAFWAIGVLAVIMYISTFQKVPEVVTGLIGGFLILSALYASIRHNGRTDKPVKNPPKSQKKTKKKRKKGRK
jgi:uncharacterized protein